LEGIDLYRAGREARGPALSQLSPHEADGKGRAILWGKKTRVLPFQLGECSGLCIVAGPVLPLPEFRAYLHDIEREPPYADERLVAGSRGSGRHGVADPVEEVRVIRCRAGGG
jgi:hypothetical protein